MYLFVQSAMYAKCCKANILMSCMLKPKKQSLNVEVQIDELFAITAWPADIGARIPDCDLAVDVMVAVAVWCDNDPGSKGHSLHCAGHVLFLGVEGLVENKAESETEQERQKHPHPVRDSKTSLHCFNSAAHAMKYHLC